ARGGASGGGAGWGGSATGGGGGSAAGGSGSGTSNVGSSSSSDAGSSGVCWALTMPRSRASIDCRPPGFGASGSVGLDDVVMICGLLVVGCQSRVFRGLGGGGGCTGSR